MRLKLVAKDGVAYQRTGLQQALRVTVTFAHAGLFNAIE